MKLSCEADEDNRTISCAAALHVVCFEDSEIAALRSDGPTTVTIEVLEVSKTVERIE